MFYSFSTQGERRIFGGSDFIEIQFCSLPPDTKIEKIISADTLDNWHDDSLYIKGDDVNEFLNEYSCIFDCGIYGNSEMGSVDIYGINYYSPDFIEPIIAKLMNFKPTDYEILTEWLNKAKKYNGFYILGI